MADFNVTRITDGDSRGVSTVVGTTGTVSSSKRMLGENGAGAQGKGEWYRSDSLWRTFFLYPQDRLQATGVGATVVEIHGCMELPDDAGQHDNAAYEVLATLNSGSPSFSTEHPWRFVRAEVTTADAMDVQVGLHEQGQG